MGTLKSTDISWKLDYSYDNFVTDNIFNELDKSLGLLNSLQEKFASLNKSLNDCSGNQITTIKNHLSQINTYVGGIKEKFESKKKEVQAKANLYQSKFNKEIERDSSEFPGGSFYSTYLYYRNGSEIDGNTEVGGPDDNNSYTIYHFSISTCTRDTHGNITRNITVTNHIFNGTSVTEPMKIRYKGTFPSRSTKTFCHYYKQNGGTWEDINLRGLINHM
ncbi:MAG: hypothetical protein J6X02_04840 [Bacilli bacterium]|nr:hypothetical protein [Bacilli bacterium]